MRIAMGGSAAAVVVVVLLRKVSTRSICDCSLQRPQTKLNIISVIIVIIHHHYYYYKKLILFIASRMASSNQTTPNINVPIGIERIDEYKIAEITYDGQERHIPPLSMSENLSRLISKIDFNQPIEELKEELGPPSVGQANRAVVIPSAEPSYDSDNERESAKSKSAGAQAAVSTWPFESMRAKLRVALTEVCVLLDVLSIANFKGEPKHMVFDAVQNQSVDQRPIVALMAKKRALQMASQILLDGATALRNINSSRQAASTDAGDTIMGSIHPSEASSGSGSHSTGSEPNFYDELKEMRKGWRLKRVGTTIHGDLSYFRPIGQRFNHATRFEVIKTSAATRGPINQALTVKLPPDLEGRAHIQVSVIKNDEYFIDLATSAGGRCYEPAKERTWQEKLEMAQNVLFCKELFSHLANQAIQHQFVIPTTVTGNQIILALFPDVKLYITLVHHTPNTKNSKDLSEGMQRLQKAHKPFLEHSLHQMLKDHYVTIFKKMQGREIPKEAGTTAMDKQTLFEITRQELSLDKIVQQAQHLILRQQTMQVIDEFVARIKDPLIISHWFCLNSPTTSLVRVDIVSHNNEILGRSHMLIYIGTRQLRVITRDCKNFQLGYEPGELRHLLIWQSCLHQFIASDKLSKLLGWYTLTLSYGVNVTRQDMSSTAFSLVICSANCSHLVTIKSGPQFGLTVDVAQFKDTNGPGILSGLTSNGYNNMNSPLNDGSIESILSGALNGSSNDNKLSSLQDLIDDFREVDWDQMQGHDFLTKLELLMAALTDIG